MPLFTYSFTYTSSIIQGFSFRKNKTKKSSTITTPSVSTAVDENNVLATVLATEIAQEAMDAITKDITTTINNNTIIIDNESSSATAPALEHETPSVAPSEGDNSNSLVDDESVVENEDHTLQERSMFPKMLKLIATLKSTKNCAVDIEPTPFGDEWLDFVDKNIMPALKTSVACGDIDDETTVASTAASSYSENKTFEFEDEESSVDESTAVLTAVSTNCEELEVEETFTLIEDNVKKAVKKRAKQSRHDVEDEMQGARLIQEYIQMLKMHEDDSPFVQSLIKKNPFMHSSAGQQPSKAKNFSCVIDAATETIFPVVATE